MTIDENDWRLRGQDTYLMGIAWTWEAYRNVGEDHAHCAFCWAKFMERSSPDVLLNGYVSTDGRYWVCKPCFDDFKGMFEWAITRA